MMVLEICLLPQFGFGSSSEVNVLFFFLLLVSLSVPVRYLLPIKSGIEQTVFALFSSNGDIIFNVCLFIVDFKMEVKHLCLLIYEVVLKIVVF